jgi:hypothetical protein
MIEPEGYCREIEAYLCRKNDGHLIRIVGPAFEQVSGWARDGIPITVVCAGIDRYFERYYRKGPRRRPVRVEFCEPDVRDAFDDWRRAVGVQAAADQSPQSASSGPRRPSLASHLERTAARLTALRSSSGAAPLTAALEDAARSIDALQPDARTARGDARERLLERLAAIDRELSVRAIAALDADTRRRLDAEALQAIAPFRDRMPADAYQKACAAALERSVRVHFALPSIAFE